MSNYGQFCPVAKSLEVLGDRWTPLIVLNMLYGITHFNDLERSLPRISRSVLARRLRLLEQAGVIEKQKNDAGRASTEYHLTQAGRELQTIIGAMMIWGDKWAFGEPVPEEVDPVLMMWWMRNDVRKERLPENRVVVEYDFRGEDGATFWLILTTTDVTLCLTNPGYDIDVLVSAPVVAFYKLWWGRISYDQAIRDYGVTVEGLPRLVQAFPGWFAWSAAAGINTVRAARQLHSASDLRVAN